MTTDNGAKFTSARYIETLNRLGITHRGTAYNYPEGNGYIERFHRSLKEEEAWLNEYQNFAQAELSIARWIEEYNHDRPHRGLHGQIPHDAPCPVRPNPYFKHGPLCLVFRGCTTPRTRISLENEVRMVLSTLGTAEETIDAHMKLLAQMGTNERLKFPPTDVPRQALRKWISTVAASHHEVGVDINSAATSRHDRRGKATR